MEQPPDSTGISDMDHLRVPRGPCRSHGQCPPSSGPALWGLALLSCARAYARSVKDPLRRPSKVTLKRRQEVVGRNGAWTGGACCRPTSTDVRDARESYASAALLFHPVFVLDHILMPAVTRSMPRIPRNFSVPPV